MSTDDRSPEERAIDDAAVALFAAEALQLAHTLALLRDRPIDEALVRAALMVFLDDLTSGEWHTEWSERMEPLIERAQVAGAQQFADLGLRFPLRNTRVTQAIQDRAQRLATYVGETTAEQITKAVGDAHQAGESASQLATRIQQTVYAGEITRSRAETIARTESSTAYETGAYETAKASNGVLAYKRWRHSGNPRQPRWDHVAMDGETVGIDELFSNGLRFPCDPDGDPEQTINCGCGCQYLSRAEFARESRR